ncbi:MAG: DoxX protein [Spirochaetota bacterium]
MSVSKKSDFIILLVKSILALNLIIFGMNKFFLFLPEIEMAPAANQFFKQLFASGYLMQLTGAVELLVAIGIFFHRTVLFAIIALAPISVNIVAFHLFLDPTTILPALVVVTLHIILIYIYKDKFKFLMNSA